MVNWRFGPRIAPSGYRVIVDRISQDIPFYRSYLKNAVLGGTNRHQQSLLVERLESPCCDFRRDVGVNLTCERVVTTLV